MPQHIAGHIPLGEPARGLDLSAAHPDKYRVRLKLLPSVADAVGDQLELICDGGIRRGSDIVKAVSLGAKACMIGRSYLYGFGAAGERGVDHALGLLAADVRRTMALTGCRAIGELDADLVAWRND